MIPLKVISDLGVKEKYVRNDHYNTIKTWWARRPLIVSRALLINELLEKKSNAEFNYDLLLDINPSKTILSKFASEFNTSNYKVLDVFSGGGSIPFEATRLGFETFSIELNPVAALLQKTIFESFKIEKFPFILRECAYKIIKRTENRLSYLFELPNKENPSVLFWGKVAKCKSCKVKLSLSKIKYLCKKDNKKIVLIKEEDNYRLNLEDIKLNHEEIKEFPCLNCGILNTYADIKKYCVNNNLEKELISVCYYTSPKSYEAANPELARIFEEKEITINNDLSKLEFLIPNERVTVKSGVINPTNYDLKYVKDFFNNRQLLVILTLIDEIIKEYNQLLKKYSSKICIQIIYGLTSLLEFLIDWNSNSTMWISQNEQSGRALAGPGVGMKWDYIEINPFLSKGANLYSKIDRVCSTLDSIKVTNENIHLHNCSSTKIPIQDNSIDIILTDPPYFDSIDYTGLSEFFRPWFEVLIRNTFDTQIDLKNDLEEEVIVELSKSNLNKDSHHYEKLMSDILRECNRVLTKDGSLLLMYSHKTIEGWKIIAKAIKASGLFISDTYALDMERSARPRAMSHQALNGVIVFKMTKFLNQTILSQDLKRLNILINNNEILESNYLIYLASLACKHYVNFSGVITFEEIYNNVVTSYEEMYYNKVKDDFDTLTSLYLQARFVAFNPTLQKNNLKLLESNLLMSNKKIKSLDELSNELNVIDGILGEAVKLYRDNKQSSNVKIDSGNKETLKKFFTILSGTELNTLKQRSSSTEIKIARTILSKI